MFEIKNYFCFDLYTAGVAIGWLGFGGSLVGTVGYSYAFVNIDKLMENTTIAALPHIDEFDAQYSEEFLEELKFCKLFMKILSVDYLISILTYNSFQILVFYWSLR